MNKLKQFLKDNNMTQRAFAKTLNISEMAVYYYLKGKRIPNRDIMQKITELTNGYVTANDFFGEN